MVKTFSSQEIIDKLNQRMIEYGLAQTDKVLLFGLEPKHKEVIYIDKEGYMIFTKSEDFYGIDNINIDYNNDNK